MQISPVGWTSAITDIAQADSARHDEADDGTPVDPEALRLVEAILFAAVCGGLITALVSAARMFQLRRAAKKNLEAALKR